MQRGRGREDARRGPRIAPCAAILAAGGRGDRASTGPDDRPKQFRDLAGRPLLLWSLDPLVSAGCKPIVAVVPGSYVDHARSLAPQGVVVTDGGASRQESVARGLEHVEGREVVVHDAARPLATPALLRRVIAALAPDVAAAVAAEPLDETVKSGADGFVATTIDRSMLWRAQTPQAFVLDALREAHEKARVEGFEATDDAQLVERIGGSVALVRGERWNVKITVDEDFEVAEAILRGRR